MKEQEQLFLIEISLIYMIEKSRFILSASDETQARAKYEEIMSDRIAAAEFADEKARLYDLAENIKTAEITPIGGMYCLG